ncbi:MAG: 2-C-methyl-D-erythritol 4-phosphate cytidylyltransferase [Oscillospiraceae bacterium]|nr:2-C-methyl-D-erythritol 4-phosphate cytidylyltransferase [Oscillospiraceae bacterium]
MSILTMMDKFKEKKAPCTAVIVAAGSSERMGRDKMFLPVAGIPVLGRTLLQFQRCRDIDEIIVVTREERIMDAGALVKQYGLDKVTKILVGGKERVESSAAGVLQANRDSGWIAIADGARPLVTPELISRTVEAARKYRAAAPAVAVKDTIKTAENGMVTGTPDRSRLFAVQTPQVFEADLIKGALTRAVRDGIPVTDDCSAVEAMGIPVRLVEGSYENIKITTREDIALCEALLAARGVRS